MDRILQEFNKLMENPIKGIEINLGQDMLHWNGLLIGPPETPFEGGNFRFDIIFPSNFPVSPPEFFFRTRIYHPNVNSEGKVCSEILSVAWRPGISMRAVLCAICHLLAEPCPEQGYVNDACNTMRANVSAYEREAKRYTADFAK
ncbi:unnamed protein product [Blepharisma stoltei]|uniref:UBC core domain-containing protein n=1 Tax=Blepharisma stoltei TaxID=1481888 RepID=A0AAU9J0X8_9CILI|nr:unnamed protein product [Blepharisma stoltei]